LTHHDQQQEQYEACSTEDIELSGVTIAAGDRVVTPLSAANHDPAKFPNPELFDITRDNASHHLAFGRGRHACLGGAFGRIRLETMIGTLLHRLPSLHLKQDESCLPWSVGLLPSRLEKLLVTWDGSVDHRTPEAAAAR
jgi:cytochrome P450